MGAFPLLYFGNISYFQAIAKVENPAFTIGERFMKQSFRNRCELCAANGKLSLHVPIIKTKGSKSLTSDIAISASENWQDKHWRSITSAYGKSAFFEFYEESVQKLIYSQYEFLHELNTNILHQCFSWLKWKKEICIDATTPYNYSELLFSGSAKTPERTQHQNYFQVFSDRHPFFENLSLLDLIFNEGSNSQLIVNQC